MRRPYDTRAEPSPVDGATILARGSRWPSPLPPTALVAGLLVCLKLSDLVMPLAPGPTGAVAPRAASGQATASLDLSPGPVGPDGQKLDPFDPTSLPLIEPSAGPAASPEAAPATPLSARRSSNELSTNGKLADVAAELAQRRDSLDRRERDLELREAVIMAAEARIGKQLERLEQLRAELKTLSDGVKAKDEAEINQLIKMYESMKAKNAATVFNELDLKVLLPIVKKMRDSKLAAVVALMDPVKAKQITAALSQPTQLPRLP